MKYVYKKGLIISNMTIVEKVIKTVGFGKIELVLIFTTASSPLGASERPSLIFRRCSSVTQEIPT